MARRIAQFEKVSFEQYKEAFIDTYGETEDEEILKVYESIRLPRRATSGSAGYDFFTPLALTLEPGKTAKIPTGIRAKMDNDWVLKLYPRSGLGFKFRLQLNNTVGIIDADYYYSDNEGHIFAKITNDSNEGKTVALKAETGFMQGIFLEYGITMDDDVTDVRNGGFGSTTK
ncbi:MAG: deoxyuridine 5'-triphosphate nucleotidohydrolase [Dorea sp.]|nr:deoxyuridine 5'-triphosphate nucleotidohydrolase [Dorea sp.]